MNKIIGVESMNERSVKNLIETVLISDGVDLSELNSMLQDSMQTKRFGDALHILIEGTGHAFVFDYGVVVTWGVNLKSLSSLLKKIAGCCNSVYDEKPKEHFVFSIGDSLDVKMLDDRLSLPDDDIKTLLAISHALAQSAKLSEFETIAGQTIEDNRYLSEELSQLGKISLNRKSLSKLRGALFQTKSDILLHFNLLDTPDFFWNYPALEPHYTTVEKYLEITPRVHLLRIKLETIQELFDMLASEQNHKHSSFLEWIIIILIAVEIVLFFVH